MNSYIGGVGTDMGADFGRSGCLLICFGLGGLGIEGLGIGFGSGIVGGKLESCCSFKAGSFGLILGEWQACFDTTGMAFAKFVGFAFAFDFDALSIGRRWGRKAMASPC